MTTSRVVRATGRWLSTKEAAERAGVSDWSIRAWIGKGIGGRRLPASQISGVRGGCRWRIHEVDLLEFLEARRYEPQRIRRVS